MKIAYLLSPYKDALHVKRLIEALHEDAEFFIHVDKKSSLNDFTDVIKAENVHFLQDRVEVGWGTMSQVEYQMRLLQAAVDYPVHFDRLFSLSGQDYPVWSNSQISEFLESLGDKEVVQGICMDSEAILEVQTELYEIARPQIQIRFLPRKINSALTVMARKFLKGCGHRKKLYFYDNEGNLVHLYKGSDWWCMTEDLARYVLDKYQHDSSYKKYFKDSFTPSETLIQTIAFNSPTFSKRCILSTGKYPRLAALTPLHFIDYNPIIQIMTEKDYLRIQESGKMFVRKVVSGDSDKLVKMLNIDREEEE
ncbi:MAG: conjugal transfer protein [Bacteroidaceae bacterium]|nr:conjugal transfer protein [Bacteroidaceae bacterium]